MVHACIGVQIPFLSPRIHRMPKHLLAFLLAELGTRFYTNTCAHNACTHACMHTCTYACTYTCPCTYARTYACTHEHVYTQIHMHACNIHRSLCVPQMHKQSHALVLFVLRTPRVCGVCFAGNPHEYVCSSSFHDYYFIVMTASHT